MSTRTSYDHGTPSWVDLMSPDVDASKAFYTEVFGWSAEDQFDPDSGERIYTNLSRDGQLVAGLGGQQPGMEGMPAFWNTYVAVDDVDAVLEKVGAAGGSVLMPAMDVMDAGRMAILTDPTGAAISLWEAGTHVGAAVVNEPGTWSWNELMSRDIETAKAFYAQVFGWEYDEQDMGPPTGTYTVVRGGEEGGLGGLMPMPAEVPAEVPSYWGVYFMVADTDAVVAEVEGRGGELVAGPMDMQVGRMATLADPLGGMFSVIQVPGGA